SKYSKITSAIIALLISIIAFYSSKTYDSIQYAIKEISTIKANQELINYKCLKLENDILRIDKKIYK
ncbi:MAG TPA: hypothetical protein DCS19_06350, partial [Flavobacterium sp.]|nr:hypothetical protein [Flavobacterium sp.]